MWIEPQFPPLKKVDYHHPPPSVVSRVTQRRVCKASARSLAGWSSLCECPHLAALWQGRTLLAALRTQPRALRTVCIMTAFELTLGTLPEMFLPPSPSWPWQVLASQPTPGGPRLAFRLIPHGSTWLNAISVFHGFSDPGRAFPP